jgi:hypothetical protein
VVILVLFHAQKIVLLARKIAKLHVFIRNVRKNVEMCASYVKKNVITIVSIQNVQGSVLNLAIGNLVIYLVMKY